jgi:hypothetical protein
MIALLIIAVGAGLYSQRNSHEKGVITPTPIVRTIPTACSVLETTDNYVVLKCDLSHYLSA